MSTASPTIEDINELVAQAAIAADSAMGTETEAFYEAEHLAITDWFVVTTGRNPRAVRALVDKVEGALTVKYSVKPITIEGKEAGGIETGRSEACAKGRRSGQRAHAVPRLRRAKPGGDHRDGHRRCVFVPRGLHHHRRIRRSRVRAAADDGGSDAAQCQERDEAG